MMARSLSERERQGSEEEIVQNKGRWMVLVWDDPINTMEYVSYVFQRYFGYSKPHAEQLMLKVHMEGQALVARSNRERAEVHVLALHSYGLKATLREDVRG